MFKIVAQSILEAYTTAVRVAPDKKYVLVEDTTIQLDHRGFKIYYAYESGDDT